jgi:phage terminase small subunit
MAVFTNTKGFTDRMERFCQQYLIDLNATQAAVRAGYSKATANEQGSRLLAKVSIKKRIKELAKQNATAAEVTPALVLSTIKETMERCGQDIRPVMAKGKQVTELDGEGSVQPVYRFDSQGVFRGAELLGRYLTLFTDKTELTGANGQPVEIISTDMEPEKAARIYSELMRR